MFRTIGQKHHARLGGVKVNFLITLVVVACLGLLALKIVPVYYSNNKLVEAAGELALRGRLSEETIRELILEKARERGIPEALEPGAVRVSKVDQSSTDGVCTVRINYTREIDLFGVATIKLPTDKEIAKAYLIL